MKMNITNIIRFILSIAILYGVFTETGIWTTISLFLILLKFEMDF